MIRAFFFLTAFLAASIVLAPFSKAWAAPDPLKDEIRRIETDSTSPAPKKSPEKAKETSDSDIPKADAKVDWADVESTGVLASSRQGGFDKTIWKGQKRSDIETLVARLPDTIALRSVLSLQRRLMLSRTDASLIKNDLPPARGNDFLLQRINALMKMGLYSDAWDLYTQKAEDTYDVSIAQYGNLLMILRGDMPTACLEEKVFAARYPGNSFFEKLDKACNVTLGTSTTPPQFPDSKILQSLYHDKAYGVSAGDTPALLKMSPLERALVIANGKIRYDGLTAPQIKALPSDFVSLYLMDKATPAATKALLQTESDRRGLSLYAANPAKDPILAKVKAETDAGPRWILLESAYAAARSESDLLPYADFIAESTPDNLSTESFTKSLRVLLMANEELPPSWQAALEEKAENKPLFYIYLQAFAALTPSDNLKLSPEQAKAGLESLKPEDMDQMVGIVKSLDKDSVIFNTPLDIYEKHSALTLAKDYVMPREGLNVLLETASRDKQTGITVLAVLNSLYAEPDRLYPGTTSEALEGLVNVGLLEDARRIGSEIAANILEKY